MTYPVTSARAQNRLFNVSISGWAASQFPQEVCFGRHGERFVFLFVASSVQLLLLWREIVPETRV